MCLIHKIAHASTNMLLSYALTYFGYYNPSRGKVFIKEYIFNKGCSKSAYNSFFLILTYFYLIPLGIRGYRCTLSYSMTHTVTLSVGVICTRDRLIHSDLYLTTHNIYKRQISMSPTGFDPVIQSTERL
jgi:hypothetical protein